jgi:hypothetical protein
MPLDTTLVVHIRDEVIELGTIGFGCGLSGIDQRVLKALDQLQHSETSLSGYAGIDG